MDLGGEDDADVTLSALDKETREEMIKHFTKIAPRNAAREWVDDIYKQARK